MKLILILFCLLSGFQTLAQNILDRNLASKGPWHLYEHRPEGKKTILLIGNSICFGYRWQVAKKLEGYRVLAWTNPYNLLSKNLYSDMKKVVQSEKIDLIHFNIGLHGWEDGRVAHEQYDSLFRIYIDSLTYLSGTEDIIWASTTPITSGKKPITLHEIFNPRIVSRNAKAKKIIDEKGFQINDLYAFCLERLHLAREDKLHWNTLMYELLGNKVGDEILSYLDRNDPDRSISYFVSTTGEDSNPGTINYPFRTITRARDAIRESREKGNYQNAKILMRGGVYEIRKTIEFNKTDNRIVLKPYKDEDVEIIGGVRIHLSNVNTVSGSSHAKGFKEEFRKKVYFIDLKSHGIYDYGRITDMGFSRPYGPVWMEPFIDGKAYQLARWPNDSTITIDSVIHEGIKRQNNGAAIFTYSSEQPKKWAQSDDIWIAGYFKHGFAFDMVGVEKLDTTNNTITTTNPTNYGFGTTAKKSVRSWYALNIPFELDKPGEYYLDRQSGILFFYPYKEDFETVDLSIMEQPIFSIEGSQEIVFQGLSISNSRQMAIYMENTEDCIIENCAIFNLGSTAVAIGQGTVGIPPIPVSRELGTIGTFRYNNTTFNASGGQNNSIRNCHIYNTGAGGIYLHAGDRITLDSANNSIENCIIHDFNRITKSYRAGINLGGVGNKIIGNIIYNAPSTAILLYGNDHLIEYNNIYDVCLEIDDQGALYYGRDPSERGHVVRYNYFHHLGMKHRSSAVYHDDGAGGMIVYGNIFLRAGTLPALIGGGSGITYKNNLFVDSPVAIHIDDRLMNWSKKSLKPGGIYDKRLKAVKFDQPPYSNRYPELGNFWNDDPSRPKRNIVQTNMFIGVNNTVRGNRKYLDWRDDNLSTSQIPRGWENKLEDRNFIPSDSILETPKDWVRIPISNIGKSTNSPQE